MKINDYDHVEPMTVDGDNVIPLTPDLGNVEPLTVNTDVEPLTFDTDDVNNGEDLADKIDEVLEEDDDGEER